jgi:branched-chain amino acid transport system substrate-binding protein
MLGNAEGEKPIMLFVKPIRTGVQMFILIMTATVLAACGGTFAPAAVQPTTAPTPVPLEGEAVIYVVAPLSGAHAQQGQAQAAGARLAAAVLNEQGGLLGRRVVVHTVNDRGATETANEAAASIAAESAGEDVVGVIVAEDSDPQFQAVHDVYLGGGLASDPLVVVPASTNPAAVSVGHPQFFRLTAPSVSQPAEIAAALQENRFKDVVALHSPTETSRLLTERFQAEAEALDIAVTDTIEITPDTTDFSAAAQAIFVQNPAALFLATNPYESGQILSALYAIDYQGGIFAVDQALPYAVVDELGCQAEGLYRASVVPQPQTVMTAGQQIGRASCRERV